MKKRYLNWTTTIVIELPYELLFLNAEYYLLKLPLCISIGHFYLFIYDQKTLELTHYIQYINTRVCCMSWIGVRGILKIFYTCNWEIVATWFNRKTLPCRDFILEILAKVENNIKDFNTTCYNILCNRYPRHCLNYFTILK